MDTRNVSGKPGEIVPFPAKKPTPAQSEDKMKLDFSELGICDDLTNDLKRKNGKGPSEPPAKWRKAIVWTVLVALIFVSIWSHFQSLAVMETLRDNPNNLTYDELVTWQNAPVRQIAHLEFLSKASFGSALIAALASYLSYRNAKNT